VTFRLAAVRVAGELHAWTEIGFNVDGADRIGLANGAVELTGPADGVSGLLVVREEGDDANADVAPDLEGIPLAVGHVMPGTHHPNGAFELDHVVVMTDSLERTSDAIMTTLGLERRRTRETDTVRQAFHRFPDQGGSRGCIVEVVESPRVEAPELFGLVVNVVDLGAATALLGDELIGRVKDAVQPGRRIATLRARRGLGLAVAFMTP
jgi:hypothetical protein